MTDSDHLVYMTKADQQELYGLRKQAEQAAARIRELEVDIAALRKQNESLTNPSGLRSFSSFKYDVQVRAGTHVIVPVEPTEAMMAAGYNAYDPQQLWDRQQLAIYAAMIKAAQEKNHD